MTRRGKTLYVHVWEWKRNRIRLPALGARVLNVRALTTDSLQWKEEGGQITLAVDADARNMPVTVVRLDLDRPADELRADGIWQDVRAD